MYSISADSTCGVAVAIFVCAYPLVTNGTSLPAVAVVISADVFSADPARRIAVLISVGVYGAIAVGACGITRSIRVQAAALGVQRQRVGIASASDARMRRVIEHLLCCQCTARCRSDRA
jgi:hypothetical protein